MDLFEMFSVYNGMVGLWVDQMTVVEMPVDEMTWCEQQQQCRHFKVSAWNNGLDKTAYVCVMGTGWLTTTWKR
jgi:hypothetical protein